MPVDPLIFGVDKEAARAAGRADPYDPLAASAGIAPASTPTIDKLWGDTPSWWQQASDQLAKDEAAYAKGGVAGLLRDVEGTMDLAGGFGDAGLVGRIKAFHGSPHDFERFDMSKIGTGEGAQAYGHGLYFAEEPKTAQSYKDATGHSASGATGYAQRLLGYESGDIDKAIARFHREANSAEGRMYPEAVDYLEMAKRGEIIPTTGKMYEVSINADPEHFLDWDKPLSEQPQNVRKFFGDVGGDFHPSELANLHAPETAAQLREAGIPGIRYLDQGSRGKQYFARPSGGGKYAVSDYNDVGHGEFNTIEEAQKAADAKNAAVPKTSNYVVFDDKLIDIIKKYGIAALIGDGISNFTPTPKDTKQKKPST